MNAARNKVKKEMWEKGDLALADADMFNQKVVSFLRYANVCSITTFRYRF